MAEILVETASELDVFEVAAGHAFRLECLVLRHDHVGASALGIFALVLKKIDADGAWILEWFGESR